MEVMSADAQKMLKILTQDSLVMTKETIVHAECETPEILQKWSDNIKSENAYKYMGDIYDIEPATLERHDKNRVLVRELNEMLHKKMVEDENKPPEQNAEEQADNGQTSANRLENVYSEEDRTDALAEKISAIKKSKTGRSDTQNFFADTNLLVTGGTGFVGKVLIEKLLRSCPGIKNIYLIVRPKKGKDANSRLSEMMQDVLFQRVVSENPKCIQKLIPLQGNLSEPGLGLSESDRQLIIQKVSIIIHAAATVRFDEPLAVAGAINVQGTRCMLQLARECQGLKAFTYVSTAFANCPRKYIEEKFYDPPIDPDHMMALSSINEQILQDITPTLLGDFPNTYCYSKAVAENVVKKYGIGLPVCIIRPSIVLSTYEEPIRGWTDNLYGPGGVCVGIGTGVLRTFLVDENNVAELVPVDYVVNAVIAATYDTAQRFSENKISDIPIYNYVSSEQNPITWGRFFELNKIHGLDIPTIHAVWYYGLNMTNNKILYLIYSFFLHYLPALLADTILFILGKKRMMLGVYRKARKLIDVLSYFTRRQWRFENGACQALWNRMGELDRQVFPFDISQMSWEYHCEKMLLGLRVYILKDKPSSLPEARKKWTRLYYAHQLVKTLCLTFILCVTYFLIVRIVLGL